MNDVSEHKKAKGTKKFVIKEDFCLKTMQSGCLMIKSYYNHNEYLKGTIIHRWLH